MIPPNDPVLHYNDVVEERFGCWTSSLSVS